MEDASKALLIAAGFFFVLLIISLMVVVHGDISEYYENKHNLTVVEQVQEFNSRFNNYNRNNIRGSDLISFMNRVIDYNASQAYNEDENYERIIVTITLGGPEIREQFKPPNHETLSNIYLTQKTITNKTGVGNNWANDRQLIGITNTPTELCAELRALNSEKELNLHNITDNKLQLLASKAEYIIVDEISNEKTEIYNRFKRADILEDVLGIKVGTTSDCKIIIDNETGITKNENGEEIINKIKEITSQYYQYMYFKRAYFDCTEMLYDPDTSRVVEMNFKLQTKLVDGKETVIFN